MILFKVLKRVRVAESGHGLHLSPVADGQYLVAIASSDQRIPLLDLRTGNALWSLGTPCER